MHLGFSNKLDILSYILWDTSEHYGFCDSIFRKCIPINESI